MGEGEAVPAAAADIKIYISGNSGSKEVSMGGTLTLEWQFQVNLPTINCEKSVSV